MAKQNSKTANRQPITANPLFPAVVALWFGALFGLGSLAVRPTLIEGIVLASRIDLIVPAAAPPLGVTARIALALALAAVGAIIGLLLVRILTRPKPEIKDRARSARPIMAAAKRPRPRDAHPDAPDCQPILVRELDRPSENSELPGVLGERRRALTADQPEVEFVPHEFVPLPGGALQVLDLAEPNGPAAMIPAAGPANAAPQFTQPQTASAPEHHPVPAQPALAEQAQPVTPTPIPPASVAAHADGRQVFGMEQPQPQPDKPRQIFGMAVADDHVPSDFVREAGYRTSVFEVEEAAPLFGRKPSAAQNEPGAAALPVAEAAPQDNEPQSAQPPAMPPVQAQPVPHALSPEPQPTVAVASPPEPVPSTLGMTDLASRLEATMRRRRAAKLGETAPAEIAAAAVPVAPAVVIPAVEPAAETGPVIAPPPAADPPVPLAYEPTPAPQPQIPVAYEPAPVPPADPIASFAATAQNFAPTLQTAAPVQAHGAPGADDDPVPEALRPLALDAFLDEDPDFVESLLPPRLAVASEPEPEFTAAPVVAAQPIDADSSESPEGDEPQIAEDSFSSLLTMNAPRAGFVRIAEPEPASGAPEPVVIFPGQAPVGNAALSAGSSPAASPDQTSEFRRFDSPAAAGHGQPVAADPLAPAMESAAADQALRAALANLQRMSGAA